MIETHLDQFHGLPIVEFRADAASLPTHPVAWRLSLPWDAEIPWTELFEQFLSIVDPAGVVAIVVGTWEEPEGRSSAEVVANLVAAAPRLTSLRALFIGEMTYEECEISWINQSDLTPLLTTFPQLEELSIRGGSFLELSTVSHASLRRLVIETGGLPASVVQAVAASDFPALTDLELWLGVRSYGGDSTRDDVAPFLRGERLPSLTRLALRNSAYEDAIAVAAATAPVVARLEELNLSMGILMDTGGLALLTGQPLTHLTTLDLTHNYLSDEVRERLRAALAPAGVQLLLDADNDDHPGKRMVAVFE